MTRQRCYRCGMNLCANALECGHAHALLTWATLLEYVYTFLSPCFETVCTVYHAQQEEVGWDLYHSHGRFWLWNNDTALWFFVDQPPSSWHRYCWFVDFPRAASSLKYWWHNVDRGHWFWEPAVPTVQHATFEVDRAMVLRAHSLL